MVVVFFLGFSSGLPLLLTSQTLQAWMTSAGSSLDQIGALSTVGLAYTFKFLWAPLLDRFAMPFLGRRRGWMLVLQLALAGAIVVMGQLDPVTTPELLFVMAVEVAVLGASSVRRRTSSSTRTRPTSCRPTSVPPARRRTSSGIASRSWSPARSHS
jgi:PAT family beta-lactamase induction signal transducer AmpG